MQGVLLIIFYAVIVLIPVTTASILGPSSGNILHEIGKSAALAGFMIIFLQVFLAARIKWIERPFGLDILIRYHKHMAVFGAFLLLSHPLLIAAGGGGWSLLIGLDVPVIIWLGKITLALLIINVLVSLYQMKLKLKYEGWRMVHDIVGPVILIFAFSHSFFAGDDLQLGAMQAIWAVLLILAVTVFFYHRIIRPLLRKRHLYRVIDVHRESEDVHTIKLAPPEGEKIPPYFPGQFHFITFYRGRNLPVEEHHWTISSSPTETGYVSSTIKALGDFTATMGETREGDKAAVHGAFGRFSYALHPEEKDLVFIAGGIGITPIRSMLRHMHDTEDDRSVILFYANKKKNEIVFQKEFSEIEKGKHPRLKIIHVLNDPDEGWQGETGFVDREKIERFCGNDLSEKVFYICGPPPMIEAVISALKNLGVSDKQIRLEIFSFLD